MNLTSTFYGLYAALPVAGQDALVSLYGYILRARRYGRGHARYLAWLMETRKLDLEGQQQLQLRELRELLGASHPLVAIPLLETEPTGLQDLSRLAGLFYSGLESAGG